MMYRSVIDQLRADGHYLPIEDSSIHAGPGRETLERGLKRFPEYYTGLIPLLYPNNKPSQYALFNLEAEELKREKELDLPELFYPAWMTAFLRHPGADTILELNLSPWGGHRHCDNLALLYLDRGDFALGDLGYVGDMPANNWIRSTLSHNLVVVDDEDQRSKGRHPAFEMMATTSGVSVVQASTDAYKQCSEYRRLVALIKGPDGQSFAVDIFRVKGGSKHAYRVSSELAASDAENGALVFEDIEMPPEPPLPEVGMSLEREDIFGLRDTRSVESELPWRAVWRQNGRSYRLWMLSMPSRVEASNGPGQRTRSEGGRRLRYVDAVREGDDLESVFVAIHEPSGADGAMPITDAYHLYVQDRPGVVAIRIESTWGTYHVFSHSPEEISVGDIRFQGDFGVLCYPSQGESWLMTLGASTLQDKEIGFSGRTARWKGIVTQHTDTTMTTDTAKPEDWPDIPDGCQNYVAVDGGPYRTGFPVDNTSGQCITIKRFPLPAASTFELPALRWLPIG